MKVLWSVSARLLGLYYHCRPDHSAREGPKPYAVLQAAMKKEDVVGIAQVVIPNREQLIVLRPVGRPLTVSVLHYDAAIRPSAAFDEDPSDAEVSTQEVKLAKMLIDTTRVDDPPLDEFHNLYNERLEELVQAKIAGEEIATPAADESGPPVINIMDALNASLERKRPRTPGSKKPLRPRTKRTKRKTGRTRDRSLPKRFHDHRRTLRPNRRIAPRLFSYIGESFMHILDKTLGVGSRPLLRIR